MVSFYLFQDFLRAWFTGTLHHPNLWHSVTDGHFLLWAGSQISNPAGSKSCYCQFTGLCNIMNINLSRAKRRAPFQPSFRALTWHAWCFRNEVSSLDAICFAPEGQGRFPGFKKKSFKLSRLLSFFAKEGSISLTLTVPSIVACGEGLCTCSFMVEQNRLLASRQRRSPSSVVVLDCSQCPFPP